MLDLTTATKEELRDYALAELAITVDMRKPVEVLRVEIGKAMKKPQAKDAPVAEDKPAFLLNKETGHWFAYTDLLAARGDLVACDEAGAAL